MYRDLRRICEAPTDEDRQWFPDIAGSDWLKTLDFAMRNFKDESFIQQFLSPKVIRDLRLFCLLDDDELPNLRVGAIHNDEGYREVRETLARQYALTEREPNVQIANVDVGGDRSMTLRHYRADRRPLHPMFKDVMKHLAYLWGFTVRLETANEDGTFEPTHEIRVDKRRRPELTLAAALRTLP
jgi:spore cortex formation protein SpoVR/YcgB (stage V sporulation)